MIEQENRRLSVFTSIPVIGLILFFALYFYSSIVYPGGSQKDLNSIGFDWLHNYWCDLFSENAKNGLHNPSRPFAIMALVVLCMSLLYFFFSFAKTFAIGFWSKAIRVSAFLSMVSAIFISTEYHDLMTIIASLFGFITVLGIIKTLLNQNLTVFKFTAVLCVLLLGLNNYIYYTNHFIEALPLLQKVTIFLVLLWVFALNLEIIKKRKMAN